MLGRARPSCPPAGNRTQSVFFRCRAQFSSHAATLAGTQPINRLDRPLRPRSFFSGPAGNSRTLSIRVLILALRRATTNALRCPRCPLQDSQGPVPEIIDVLFLWPSLLGSAVRFCICSSARLYSRFRLEQNTDVRPAFVPSRLAVVASVAPSPAQPRCYSDSLLSLIFSSKALRRLLTYSAFVSETASAASPHSPSPRNPSPSLTR